MRARYEFKQGDLVQWFVGSKDDSKSGIVMDIYPSNVYENESCLIFCENREIMVDSKFLKFKSAL